MIDAVVVAVVDAVVVVVVVVSLIRILRPEKSVCHTSLTHSPGSYQNINPSFVWNIQQRPSHFVYFACDIIVQLWRNILCNNSSLFLMLSDDKLQALLLFLKVHLHIQFPHAFSALHCDFLLLTLVLINQGK